MKRRFETNWQGGELQDFDSKLNWWKYDKNHTTKISYSKLKNPTLESYTSKEGLVSITLKLDPNTIY